MLDRGTGLEDRNPQWSSASSQCLGRIILNLFPSFLKPEFKKKRIILIAQPICGLLWDLSKIRYMTILYRPQGGCHIEVSLFWITFSFIMVVRACSRACSCPTWAESSTNVLLRFSFLAYKEKAQNTNPVI